MKKLLILVPIIVVAAAGYWYFTRTNTPERPSGGTVYTSKALGITFSYLPSLDDQTFAVKESGNRIYVYMAKNEATTGQYVEVFDKRTNESFEQSIRRQILANYPSTSCKVELTRSNIYPGAWVAEIGYPPATNASDPFWVNAPLCNDKYDKTNGVRYFLYDETHPDRFVFLSVGQYGIPGTSRNNSWTDTLRIIAR